MNNKLNKLVEQNNNKPITHKILKFKISLKQIFWFDFKTNIYALQFFKYLV